MTEESSPNLVELATKFTIAWRSHPNNRTVADDVPAFLQKINATVIGTESGSASINTDASDECQSPVHVAAVTARKSLTLIGFYHFDYRRQGLQDFAPSSFDAQTNACRLPSALKSQGQLSDSRSERVVREQCDFGQAAPQRGQSGKVNSPLF
jgi:hypothetical protein